MIHSLAAQVALVGALGMLLSLERSATPGLLLSQPIFAAALCGALLGRFEAALAAGAIVQLVFLGVLPVGGARLPDTLLGGLAAALAAPAHSTLAGTAWLDDPNLAAPAIAGVLASYAGGLVLEAQASLQQRLAAALPLRLEATDATRIERLHAGSLVMHAVRGALCASLLALLAPRAATALADLGVAAPAGRIALGLAAVSLLRTAGGRRRLTPLALGGLLGIALAVL
jgi:mannose/fructose/N-acetylgalactosamine-specific phosphotransferase system component IIC